LCAHKSIRGSGDASVNCPCEGECSTLTAEYPESLAPILAVQAAAPDTPPPLPLISLPLLPPQLAPPRGMSHFPDTATPNLTPSSYLYAFHIYPLSFHTVPGLRDGSCLPSEPSRPSFPPA
jgi:hypothetical protein